MSRPKVAIVGTGIAGNVAARGLSRSCDITVYEADSYVGGHTNTVTVQNSDGEIAVDTGFIVFNDRNYPGFSRLLDELDVATEKSCMSFSVRCAKSGLEYNGANLNTLFAQRRNCLRPSFHRMLRDIVRFNRESAELLGQGELAYHMTVAEYLSSNGYSRQFASQYLIPMAASIWSAESRNIEQMPISFLVRFFKHHGLLDPANRPQWRVVSGGSARYVRKLVAGHRHNIRLNTKVDSISRQADHLVLKCHREAAKRYDHVVLACHSDQALRIIQNPSAREEQVLGAIPFQSNSAILHTDSSVMPQKRLAWAAWNHLSTPGEHGRVSVTYHMNRLQNLATSTQYFVTLNSADRIEPSSVIREISYQHPVFTAQSLAAQARYDEINGQDRLWYCGAYWRNGFHEDGVAVAGKMLRKFKEVVSDAQCNLQRAS